jgi:hypothetical protein
MISLSDSAVGIAIRVILQVTFVDLTLKAQWLFNISFQFFLGDFEVAPKSTFAALAYTDLNSQPGRDPFYLEWWNIQRFQHRQVQWHSARHGCVQADLLCRLSANTPLRSEHFILRLFKVSFALLCSVFVFLLHVVV